MTIDPGPVLVPTPEVPIGRTGLHLLTLNSFEKKLPDAEMLNELYLAVLTRPPEPAEVQTNLEYVAKAKDRRKIAFSAGVGLSQRPDARRSLSTNCCDSSASSSATSDSCASACALKAASSANMIAKRTRPSPIISAPAPRIFRRLWKE